MNFYSGKGVVWGAQGAAAGICLDVGGVCVQAQDLGMEFGISAMIYVSELNLVVTGDQHGSINTWDLTNGKMCLSLVSVHGDAMVTAFATSHNGNRLLSSASNGDVYIWNTMSGTLLQKLVKADVREVNALIACKSINRVYVSGYGGTVHCFETDTPVDITMTPMTVNETTTWCRNQKRGDEVLATASLTDTMIVTACFDGNLNIWDLRMAKKLRTLNLKTYLKKLDKSEARPTPAPGSAGRPRTGSAGGRRSASPQKQVKTLPSHFPQTGAVDNAKAGRHIPVRQVLWLKERVRLSSDPRNAASATLIASCDGGFLCFWHVHNEEIMGAFYAVDDELGSQYVSSMATDSKNDTLYTARQSQSLTSRPFFSKMACKQNLDLRCVLISDPSTLGAGAKTRLQNKEVYATLCLQASQWHIITLT